jgi:hypothetical protein
LIENTIIEYEEGFDRSTSLGLLKNVNYTEHRLLSSSGTWASSNEDVVTIDNAGNLTPISEGKTTISVEYEGYTDSVEVEVVKAEFTGIGCRYYDVKEKDHVILEEGEEINLEYFRHSEEGVAFDPFLISTRGKKYYLFENDKATFEVENPDIVSIENYGEYGWAIKAESVGSTTVTVGYKGLKKSIKVNVLNTKIKNISLMDENITLLDQGSGIAKLYAELEDGSTVDISYISEWSSSDESVVRVNEKGEMWAVKGGKAVMTVKYKDFIGTVNVFVRTGKRIQVEVDNPIMVVMESISDKEGKRFEIDPGRGTKPIIRNDRILVPIRTIVEEFGGSINWDNDSRKVTIKANDKNIVLTIDKYDAEVNGKVETMNVAPIIHNDRTMLPLRFISENLGLDVEWDDKTKTATIRDDRWWD